MRARIPEMKRDRPRPRPATIRDLLTFFDAFAARSAAGEKEKRLRDEMEGKASVERSALAS